MSKVIILTGAGISAESGIPTFRGENGLWNGISFEKVCKVGCLEQNRKKVIEFYDDVRLELKDKMPNKAHLSLAKLKKMYPDKIKIFTQNVDDLFEKAGLNSDEIIHLHGELTKIECEECGEVFEIGYQKQDKCPICNSQKLRPFVVFYGENAPNYIKLFTALKNCELFIVIGTRGNISIINDIAKDYKSILNNLEKSDKIDDKLFYKVYYEKATTAIDKIVEDIKEILKGD